MMFFYNQIRKSSYLALFLFFSWKLASAGDFIPRGGILYDFTDERGESSTILLLGLEFNEYSEYEDGNFGLDIDLGLDSKTGEIRKIKFGVGSWSKQETWGESSFTAISLDDHVGDYSIFKVFNFGWMKTLLGSLNSNAQLQVGGYVGPVSIRVHDSVHPYSIFSNAKTLEDSYVKSEDYGALSLVQGQIKAAYAFGSSSFLRNETTAYLNLNGKVSVTNDFRLDWVVTENQQVSLVDQYKHIQMKELTFSDGTSISKKKKHLIGLAYQLRY